MKFAPKSAVQTNRFHTFDRVKKVVATVVQKQGGLAAMEVVESIRDDKWIDVDDREPKMEDSKLPSSASEEEKKADAHKRQIKFKKAMELHVEWARAYKA